MSTLTEQIKTQLQLHRRAALIKNQAQGLWYTGNDLLEDITLFRTSLQQQSVGAGQQLVLSTAHTAALPIILLASWELGINVTLVQPTATATLSTQASALVYTPQQTQQLARQLDPQQVSLLTLILNTAPNFAYLVHDLAPVLIQTPEATLTLPGDAQVYSQADLLAALTTTAAETPITDMAQLDQGILPLLAKLLRPTPFTLCAS